MSQLKVLIVDDEEDFASTLSERLRLRDYDARAVFHAKDALTIIKSSSYEVVLLDVDMPGMNSIDVLKAIKETVPTIQVIMLTGGGNIRNMEEALQIGACDYQMKPIEIEELIISINNAGKK